MREMTILNGVLFLGTCIAIIACFGLYNHPEVQMALDRYDIMTITLSDKFSDCKHGTTIYYVVDTNNNVYNLYGDRAALRYKNYVINETYHVEVYGENTICNEEGTSKLLYTSPSPFFHYNR